MKVKGKERLQYRYENFMAKGAGAIFWSLLLLFIVAFGVSIFFRWFLLQLKYDNTLSNFWQHIWLTFLQIIDPGAIMEDTDATLLLKISAIITTFLGIVIFSMLIAFITTRFEQVIYDFRKGRSRVIEKNHTLILGWNQRIIDIIHELIIANESEKSAGIVILADRSKEETDEIIYRSVPDTKTTRIVTREGTTSSLTDLHRVNVAEAKSVIILAMCSETSSDEEKALSDNQVIKTILAIIAAQNGNSEIPIVAEIFLEPNRKLLDNFDSESIVSVNAIEILGKALVQTSLTSGLEMVFNEIFSFDGAEIYFYEHAWQEIGFNDLAYHFPDGIPLGIVKKSGELILRPEGNPVMEAEDRLLILADDDSAIDFHTNVLYTPADFPYEYVKNEQSFKRELILGWHKIGGVIIDEYAEYLEKGSEIDIVVSGASADLKKEIDEINGRHENLTVSLFDGDPMSPEDLGGIQPFDYDNLIILSQDEGNSSPEKNDTDTLIILLLLRKLAKKTGVSRKKTKIITQILNSENQELIHQSEVDDFIISNKMISMLFAQLSEEPRIHTLYAELFEEGGSEFYLKPAGFYFSELPVRAAFCDIIHAVTKRNEICLGIQSSESMTDPKKNFGIVLNPKKDEVFTIDKGDNFVVLAEDIV